MLNCSKCGQELADNAKFCHKCGSPVDVPNVTTVTVSEIDTVSKLIELEKEWKRKEFEYNNFKIGEYPYPKPIEPQKPERESVNLLTYPKLELEPMPEFTQYLPEMPPEPILNKTAKIGIVNLPISSSKKGNLKINVTIIPIAARATLKVRTFTPHENTLGSFSYNGFKSG
jgi:hypothetical protein